MVRSSVILCGVAAVLMGVPSFAQPAASKPAPGASTPDPKTAQPGPAKPQADAPKPDSKTDAKPAVYPPAPAKQLYADNDFRNKKAPKLEVEEWRSAKPDWTGKTLLIDFWATWCKPCRDLMPELEAWQAKYKDDLVVVGITSETKKTVDNFIDLRGAELKYAMARDGQNRTNKEIGVKGIPHVLVISSDGIVRWQGFPTSEEDTLTEAKLKQIIDADKAARAKAGTKPADAKPEVKPEARKPGGK